MTSKRNLSSSTFRSERSMSECLSAKCFKKTFGLVGILTDPITSESVVCLQTNNSDKLVEGLMDPYMCGYTNWTASSYKQV